MPAKKKGKKKKKKAKKTIMKGTDYNYVDPILHPTMVKFNCMLATPDPLRGFMRFDIEVPITSRIEFIKQKILEKYGGTVSNISICIGPAYSKTSILGSSEQISSHGVTTDNTGNILTYDFDDKFNPMLFT